MVNQGLVHIQQGTLRTIGSGGYTFINRGTVQVDGGASVTDVFSEGGTVQGGGTISGNLNFGGTGNNLRPGAGAGTLTVTGNLTLSSGTTFHAELNGNTPGSGHDQLVVAGTVTLGGAAPSIWPWATATRRPSRTSSSSSPTPTPIRSTASSQTCHTWARSQLAGTPRRSATSATRSTEPSTWVTTWCCTISRPSQSRERSWRWPSSGVWVPACGGGSAGSDHRDSNRRRGAVHHLMGNPASFAGAGAAGQSGGSVRSCSGSPGSFW